MAPWCSGLTCHPVTVEIGGSNPPGVATSNSLLTLGLYPVIVDLPHQSNHKILFSFWSELIKKHESKGLRGLAKEYGVSHEAVRSALKAAEATSSQKNLSRG